MIDFAKYAFNKSHAATYAVVAFQTAYLKVYHPSAYLAALMTSFRSNSSKRQSISSSAGAWAFPSRNLM